MSETPTPDPDVIAYDEQGDVIFVWQGCPDVTDINELPTAGLGRMAVNMAHIIRRRDGYVLKSRDGVTGFPQPDEGDAERIEVPDLIAEQVAEQVDPTQGGLQRVDIIPPPEELADHTPLGNEGLMRIALWCQLMQGDEDILLTDRDVLKAINKGSLSIEHTDDGNIIVRAHTGSLDHMPIKPEEQQ